MSKRKKIKPSPETPWASVEQVINSGGELRVKDGSRNFKIASLHDGEQLICMFECKRIPFRKIMDRLDALAKRYIDDGIVTDEVNGSEYCVL